MNEKKLWTIKYSPQKESEIVGNPKAVSEIKMFLNNWSSRNKIKALLLLGPAGCGKTSSVHLMAKLNNYNVIEINASDVRSKKSIEENILPTVATRSIDQSKKKLYLIDEVDGLSGNQDRGGLSAMFQVIKLSRFPIIFTANDIRNSKFTKLRSKKKDNPVKIITFKSIHESTIAKVLQKICIKEKIKADLNALIEIAKNVNKDLRSAINDLQAITEGKRKLSISDVKGLQQVRDVEKNIFTVLTIIFHNKNIQDCKQAVSSLDIDWGLLLQWVNESLPFHKASPEILYRAYIALSKADIIWNRIKSNPEKISWSMLPYFIDIISSGVTFPIKNQNLQQHVSYYKNFPRFFFNSFQVYGSGNNIKITYKLKNKLKANIFEIITKHIPYIALILKKKSKISQELIDFFELERRETTYLKKFA